MSKDEKALKTIKKHVFRSCWDNKGWTEKKVSYPPRITDSSQYEPVAKLVAKFLRGEGRLRYIPQYEVSQDVDPSKAIDEMPITRQDGFDLSDGSEALQRAKEVVTDLRNKKVSKKAEVKKDGPGDAQGANPAQPGPANGPGSVKQGEPAAPPK